ncbi:MAG: hypothetical protein ACOYB7_02915 [Mycobacterium sp.]
MSDGEHLQKMFEDLAAGQATGEWDSGCAHCDADVRLECDADDPLILHVWIAHDDDCPVLKH